MREHYRITNQILRDFNIKVYAKVVIPAKYRVYAPQRSFLRKPYPDLDWFTAKNIQERHMPR